MFNLARNSPALAHKNAHIRKNVLITKFLKIYGRRARPAETRPATRQSDLPRCFHGRHNCTAAAPWKTRSGTKSGSGIPAIESHDRDQTQMCSRTGPDESLSGSHLGPPRPTLCENRMPLESTRPFLCVFSVVLFLSLCLCF